MVPTLLTKSDCMLERKVKLWLHIYATEVTIEVPEGGSDFKARLDGQNL